MGSVTTTSSTSVKPGIYPFVLLTTTKTVASLGMVRTASAFTPATKSPSASISKPIYAAATTLPVMGEALVSISGNLPVAA
jgi:hypothetical protein